MRQKTENHIEMIFRLIMTTVYLIGIICQNHSLFYRAFLDKLQTSDAWFEMHLVYQGETLIHHY